MTRHNGNKKRTAGQCSAAGIGLVPPLRFPEFSKTGGWQQRRLIEFMSESRVLGSKGNVAKKITVKLWGNGVFEKKEIIEGSVNTQYYRRKSGQFIYSKLDFLNQAFGIIPSNLDGFESTGDLPCFDVADCVDSGFILEYAKRREFYERFGETADGSRKARRVHAETFLSFTVAIPSLAEQHKIADCLSSLDELIAAQARKVEALKKHKKGLMQQLFPRDGETQPRWRFPEFQDAGDWVQTSLGKISVVLKGKGISKADLVANGSQPCIRYGELYTRYGETIKEAVSKTNVPAAELTLSEPNDVIIPASGETKIDIAKASCVLAGGIALGGDLNVIRTKLNGVFLSYYLNGPKRADIAMVAQGDTVVHLYPKQLALLVVAIPSPAEQQRIADCLTSLDELITAESQRLDALKTHKRALMQQLFPSPEDHQT